MLKSSDYVILIALDSSRAFDTKNTTPFLKNTQNWKYKAKSTIGWYLSSKIENIQQNLKVWNQSRAINSSVVQGSVLGPASYSVAAADLRPKSKSIKMHKFKFADDMSLITAGEKLRSTQRRAR